MITEQESNVLAGIIHKQIKTPHNSYNNNLNNRNNCQKIIKSIKNKCTDNNLIICKADKGNTITILNKTDYIDKVDEFITENNFIELKKDPTNTFQNQVINEIKTVNTILPNNEIYKLKTMNPTAPVLYGQPKIHKTNIPIRPVVSYINSPTYKLCQYLSDYLPKIINCSSKYAVKNTYEFIDKTKNLKIPTNATMVSFDVKSLFTSIPITELKNIILNKLDNSKTSTNIQEIIALINLCIDQSYFRFNNKFYLQKNGLPMGSPLSPLLTEIYMAHFEETIFYSNSTLIKNIHFWCRYVDDVFCIWTGTERQLHQFLNFLNDINHKIQFTIEK